MSEYIDKDYLFKEVEHTQVYNNIDKEIVEDLMSPIKIEDATPIIFPKWFNSDYLEPFEDSRCYTLIKCGEQIIA